MEYNSTYYIKLKEKNITRNYSGCLGILKKTNIPNWWTLIWNYSSILIALSRNISISSRKIFTTCSKFENLCILCIEYEQLIYCVIVYVYGIRRGSNLVIFLSTSPGTSLSLCAIRFIRYLCPYNDMSNLNFVFKRWQCISIRIIFTIP